MITNVELWLDDLFTALAADDFDKIAFVFGG
jgi:hypothetical protein